MSKSNVRFDSITIAGANPGNDWTPNPAHNGDRVVNYVNECGIRIFGVIDGAKAPYDYQVSGMPNDAFASKLMATLVESCFFDMESVSDWSQRFGEMINVYRYKMEQVQNDKVEQGVPGAKGADYRLFNPGCAFALAIMDENTGDCVVLHGVDCYMVVRKNGMLHKISEFDEAALIASGRLVEGKMLSDLVAEGMDLEDAKEYERKRVRENRKRTYNKCVDGRNKGGHAIFNGDAELLKNVQVNCFNLKDDKIDAFVAMTDGYCQKLNNEQVLCAAGTLEKGVTQFFNEDVKPLWTDPVKGNVVKGDVTCATLEL